MDLIEIFRGTLGVSKKYFGVPKSNFYEDSRKIRILWSEDTVKSIFETEGKIAALNFADDEEPGGLVWEGAVTQEECLCRCSNLYLSLIEHKNDYYRREGGMIYSKDVVFFRGSDYKWREPRKCDIITCAALGSNEDIERKMRMIVEIARLNGVEVLILGKWGCGAFGRDWNEMKRMWDKVLDEVNK